MVMQIIASEDPESYYVILGPMLKAAIRAELRLLIAEWNFVGRQRREEITAQAEILIALLDGSDT